MTLIDGIITIPITKDVDESVRHFLMEYSALFGFKKDISDLKFITKTYSLDTHHIRYQQFHEEIPVLYAFISIHLNEAGSYFDYDSKEITFGGGEPPDAEDADIIIHEYGHAIIDDQVPNFGLTDEGCAMEQGFGRDKS